MSKAFEVLSMALDEAIQDARSQYSILKSEVVAINIEPIEEYSPDTIKAIRQNTGLTQDLFAKWLGVSAKTVEA